MLLEVAGLKLYYRTRSGAVKAVDNVEFDVDRGETLALIGESGSGKSSIANAILRLLPRNVETYTGKIVLEGRNLMDLRGDVFRREVAWKSISMVFQGAMNSLNPVLKVGVQVAEPLMIHYGLSGEEALKRAVEAMELVKLPGNVAERYPHELSGGMKQRVVIAMALVTNPKVVILDEPTSALDVITQANIMNTLKTLKRRLRISYIFITHDLALASELADRVAVMYGGEVVEYGSAEDVYGDPRHPYTRMLLASVPTIRVDKRLEFIPGAPPDLVNPPPGCRFWPRCPFAMETCKRNSIEVVEGGRKVRCHLYSER
jgi:peptide/nickel transport system ATP-binding protein